MAFEFVALIAFMIWLYLAFAHGGFWLGAERDDFDPPALERQPKVCAVIPARNEADGVGQCVGSLLRQDYPGLESVVLVDDESTDGTADTARRAAAACDAADRLAIVPGTPLPRELDRQAVGHAARHRRRHGVGAPAGLSSAHRCRYRLQPRVLSWLVAHACAEDLSLASFMV